MVGRGGVSSSALGWESRRIVGVTRRRAALAVVVEAAGGGGGGDLGVTRRPGKELVRFSSVEEEEEEEEVEWEEAAEGVWALGAKVTVEEDGGESMVRGEEGEGGVEGSKEEEEEVASGSSGAGGLGGGRPRQRWRRAHRREGVHQAGDLREPLHGEHVLAAGRWWWRLVRVGCAC